MHPRATSTQSRATKLKTEAIRRNKGAGGATHQDHGREAATLIGSHVQITVLAPQTATNGRDGNTMNPG